MDLSTSKRIYVRYDGPALATHMMDIRDLAPSLFALSELLQAANQEINGDRSKIQVLVKSDFKSGSFGVDLVATQHLLTQLKEFFSGDGVAAVCNAMTLMSTLGLSGEGGLIGLLRRLNGREPEFVREMGEISEVRLANGESILIPLNVVKLYQNKKVRKNLAKFLSPLKQEGIAEVRLVVDDQLGCKIDETEVDALCVEPKGADSDMLSSTTRRWLIQVINAPVELSNEWKVSDGDAIFNVTVVDLEFLKRLDAGEEDVEVGDLLFVDLHQVQSMRSENWATESTVLRVVQHFTGTRYSRRKLSDQRGKDRGNEGGAPVSTLPS